MKKQHPLRLNTLIAAAISTMVLSACGSSSSEGDKVSNNPEDCNFPEHLSQNNASPGDPAAIPTFHRLPAELPEPGEGDAPFEVDSSAVLDVDTKNLSDDKLSDMIQQEKSNPGSIQLKSTPRKPIVYNPAQIRAAYGLPPVPRDLSNLTPEQAASLGAGQTIYIVVAFDNPSLVSDLNAFSSKFNLPMCNEVKVAVNTKALQPAPNNCTVSVVYSVAGGGMSDKKPAYDGVWATESALDVQWAHAIAPLARKVVIEGRNALVGSLADAVRTANNFGPGVVSMSFVAQEASFVKGSEPIFAVPNMTYVAAAGDYGYQANWPAVSPSVVSVGGTTLNGYSDTGRNETSWKGTGGAFSSQFPMPTWQSGLNFPSSLPKTRVGVDLSFNADPYTGHYVAFTKLGAKTPTWYSMGGTSAGTPQISALVAVVNAQRALLGKPPVGKIHENLYRDFGPGLGASAQALTDVTVGANGTCNWCSAKFGYDIPSGWGTPNANRLIPLMVNK